MYVTRGKPRNPLADCPAVSFVHICIHICLLTMTMKFPKNLCKCINRPSRHKNQETSQSHCSDPKNAQSRNRKIVFTIKKKRVHIENWQRVWMSWKGYWEGYWSHHFNNFPKIHGTKTTFQKYTLRLLQNKKCKQEFCYLFGFLLTFFLFTRIFYLFGLLLTYFFFTRIFFIYLDFS